MLNRVPTRTLVHCWGEFSGNLMVITKDSVKLVYRLQLAIPTADKSINPYQAEGYSRLVSTSAKCDYSRDRSKCSSMPSTTIVLYGSLGGRCYPLFIILYIFLRWGHSFLVYIVPILCHTAKKMKTTKLS